MSLVPTKRWVHRPGEWHTTVRESKEKSGVWWVHIVRESEEEGRLWYPSDCLTLMTARVVLLLLWSSCTAG